MKNFKLGSKSFLVLVCLCFFVIFSLNFSSVEVLGFDWVDWELGFNGCNNPEYTGPPGAEEGWNGGGGGTPTCNCTCNTCNPPACPTKSVSGYPGGTDSTDRGNACYDARYRRDCGFTCNPAGCGTATGCFSAYRSCWWFENNAAPSTPTEIEYKLGDRVCNLGGNIRVPYQNFGSADGFLSKGAVNTRAGDPIGMSPLLRYRYRIPLLGLVSNYLSTSTRYAPASLTSLVLEGEVYTIYSRANSINRCQGNADGSEISRTFQINNVPIVRSIEPVGDPNNGVSGNISYDGSVIPEDPFDCVVDNPKTFRVVFEDLDGCGDIWREYTANTNICGSAETPSISLRAIDSVTGEIFAPRTAEHLSAPYNVSCEGNRLTAYFDITFVGDENIGLEIQAKADDILGESSGWQSRQDWLYDGLPPEVEIDSNIIVGADEVELYWFAKDSIPTRAGVNISGVRSVRISTLLEYGDILRTDDSYGPIFYEGEEIPVNDPVGQWHTSLLLNPSFVLEITSRDSVQVGRNQDGNLDFRLEVVDRACNYSRTSDGLELGSAWIATRGGLVHSGGTIDIAVKKSLYSTIIPSLIEDYSLIPWGEDGESTSLSTELVTSGFNILGFNHESFPFYSSSNYFKHPTLSRPWYDILYSRALSRDPEGTSWSLHTGDVELEKADLDSNCIDNRHIYFIDGNLTILSEGKDYYKDLGTPGVSGCVFVISNNFLISEGEHVSADSEDPKYDLVRGYFVVDGVIDIEFVDGGKTVRDGLKIVGGLFATGGEKSIKLGRSLQLRNNLLYPTVIIFHDAKYLEISRSLLGDTLGGGYIRDVGFIE